MKRVRIVGVCFVAIFALSAIVAASASAAQPEYTTCGKAAKVGKVYHGKYSNKLCSEVNPKGEGKYERDAVKLPSTFKSTSGVTDLYLYSRETKTINETLQCTKDKATGKILNSFESEQTITYSDCNGKGELPGECNSAGQKEGVIVTEPLVGRLVWTDEAENEVGLALSAKTPGGALEKVSCVGGVEHAELLGSVVGKISPVGSASKTETLSFVASDTTGEQEFAGFWEGKEFHEDLLTAELTGAETFSDVAVGQTTTETQKGGLVVTG